MSTTAAGSSNSSRYLDFDEYVDLKLQKTRSTIQTTDVLVALAGVAAMFLGYLLVFVVLDQWVVPGGFGIGLRWMLLSTLLIATTAWLVWKVGRPCLRSVNRLFAAREIEKADPDLQSNLLNLVDLRSSGRLVDPAIMRSLEKHAAVQLQKIDITQAIDHRPLMRTAYVLLAVVVLFCLYALFSPKKISNSIWRSLLPSADVTVATRTEILKVEPGDQTVLARSRIEVSADLAGEIPSQVWLYYTTADGKFRNEPVELRTEGEGQTRFKGMLVGENGQGLLQDLTYLVRAGDAVSREYRITVEQPPSATIERTQYEFPAYMKLDPTEQGGGQIDAWEGTKVTLHAHTNIPVRSAVIEFLDDPAAGPNGEEIPVAVSGEGRQLTAVWILGFRSDGTYARYYRVQCKTEAGKSDPAPAVHGLTIRPDLPPEVSLLEPVRDLEAPANAIIPLAIEARDPDFELSHINLHIEKDGQRIHKEPLSEGRQQRLLLKHDLKLERLVLKAGDTIEFWVEAFDNRQPRPNSKNTPRLKVRIIEPVSDKDVQQKLAEDQSQRDQKLAEARQEQNADGQPEQPPMGEGAEQQEPKDQDPRKDQPMPRGQQPPNGDDANRDDGRSEAAGNSQKNGKGQNPQDGNAGQQDSADKTQSDATKGGEKGGASDKQQPLSPDGDDDQRALEKLIQRLNQPKPGQGNDRPDSGEKTGTEPKSGNQPKDSDGSKQPNEPNKSGPKNSTTQRGGDSEDRPPSDEGTPKTEPMPKGSGTDEPKSTNEGTGQGNEPGKKELPGAKKDTTQPDGSGSADDKPQDQPSDKGSRPDANTGRGSKPDEPKAGEKPDVAKPEQQPGQRGTDQPDKATGGTPAKDDSAEKEPQSKPSSGGTKPDGESTAGGKSEPKDDKEKGTGKPGDSDSDGPREQAKDSPDAERKPATGSEQGVGTPDNDPNAKPTPAQGDGLERDPKDKPATRPGDPKSGDPSSPPKNDTLNETKDPKQQGRPDNPKFDQQTGEPGKSPSTQRNEKRDGDPKTADEPVKGDGRKDQRSDKPQGGEGGGSKQDKEGNPGSKQSGEGESESRPGTQETSDSETGKPGGDKQGPGTETKDAGKSDKKSGGSDQQRPKGDGQPGGQEDGEQKSNGQQSKDGEPSGKPGQGQSEGSPPKSKQPGKGAPGQMKPGGEARGNSGEGALGGQPGPATDDASGAGAGDAGAANEGDPANLEYKKQATELVLKRLQEGLERGDIDPELLKQLGWTEAEMKRFTERLSKHLEDAKSEAETPESAARRQQFEEMLKNLQLTKPGAKRSGENSPQREVNQIESRRGTVPQEYRSAYEKFTRELSRQKSSAPKPSK